MSEHTPGPWTWAPGSQEGCSAFDAVELEAGNETVIYADHGTVNDIETAFLCFGNAADAPLVAAAPSLLEACKAVIAVEEYTDALSVEVAVIRTRKLCQDAIAEAEKESHA